MTAAVVIDLRRGRLSGLAARMRNEDGMGLIELLIALLVLNVGIFATLAAFTSAASTLRRSSRVSTAAAIADQEIETLHNLKYSQIVNVGPATWPNAPDGGSYTYQVVVTPGQVTGGSANLEQAADAELFACRLEVGRVDLADGLETVDADCRVGEAGHQL